MQKPQTNLITALRVRVSPPPLNVPTTSECPHHSTYIHTMTNYHSWFPTTCQRFGPKATTNVTLQEPPNILSNFNCYRPQTKLRKGNVFTSVCQEFCPQEGGGVHPQTDLPPGRHPPGKTPPAPSRRLLLRTLRILLECILVLNVLMSCFMCVLDRGSRPPVLSYSSSFTIR